MSESASTPRLRATFAIYLALIPVTALIGPREIPLALHLLAGCVGFVLIALACLGRIWCSVFIAGHKDETLVTAGPYARCRHPLYACSLLGALGLGLTTRSPLLCAIVVALIAALVVYAAACEEQFLEAQFPEEFKAYAAAVPNKWWPHASAAPPPERLAVRPAIYWKAFVDAGSFFLLYVLVSAAAEYRIVPTF
jgi:protein-S-isoprenylcysteine O-methyltransferase Ste14